MVQAKRHSGEYDIKIPHNKGTTVFESSELAQQYYSAKRLYVSDIMKKFNKTPRGTLSNAVKKYLLIPVIYITVHDLVIGTGSVYSDTGLVFCVTGPV